MKMDKFKLFLYLSAVLLIVIPTIIVFMSDVTFTAAFSSTVIITSIVLVILGKLITVFQKRKENKSFAIDIGAIVGLSIVITLKLI
ncbi:histidine kinase [Halalkalibacter alkalisediminis]|uniref:Histidine kinase n=1 Tax=Halalkalibacter alkalisediminis TaxID=935616 RepID=A0ABV6NL67_9BACI|nr:histidine kinase [Halalkalibacter alkalisediminis]